MTNAVIFGAAIITVLNVPALSTNAYYLDSRRGRSEPYSSRAYSWLIAPRLQARYDRWHTKQ
jgi:hypothetical protein